MKDILDNLPPLRNTGPQTESEFWWTGRVVIAAASPQDSAVLLKVGVQGVGDSRARVEEYELLGDQRIIIDLPFSIKLPPASPQPCFMERVDAGTMTPRLIDALWDTYKGDHRAFAIALLSNTKEQS